MDAILRRIDHDNDQSLSFNELDTTLSVTLFSYYPPGKDAHNATMKSPERSAPLDQSQHHLSKSQSPYRNRKTEELHSKLEARRESPERKEVKVSGDEGTPSKYTPKYEEIAEQPEEEDRVSYPRSKLLQHSGKTENLFDTPQKNMKTEEEIDEEQNVLSEPKKDEDAKEKKGEQVKMRLQY